MGSQSSKLASLLSIGLAALAVCICLFPLLYALLTSLKTGSELFSRALLPSQASLENYRALFSSGQSFGRHLINSIMVASLTVTACLLLSLGAAFALGRVHFAGKSLLLMTILAVSMFPQVAVLSGMFELMQMLGLYNRAGGLHEPTFEGNEWKYLKECLDSSYVSSVGKFVDKFEEELAEFTGAKYAISVVNGTSALHIALRLAGVQPGDEVLVPALIS